MARYFEPQLKPAALLPPQTFPGDKFGGLPWGLPANRWPFCAKCHQPQSLLAQLWHHSQRLDLGRDGRVLHVFQCADWWNNGCDTAEWESGANACFILEPEELQTALTPAPGPIGRPGDQWAWHGHIGYQVYDWSGGEDALPAEMHEAYFGPNWWLDVPYDVQDAIHSGTKLGGIPAWSRAGPYHLERPWRFALQMSDVHSFPKVADDDLARLLDETGQSLTRSVYRNDDDEGSSCRWANFGEGIGYVYLNDANPPMARFAWQRD